MKGIVTKALAGAALAGGLSASGCENVQKCVDPCWPEPYNNTARREVISAFAPQVQNGHILDQTLYNYQFVEGKAELTASGRDQLDTLVRRRPVPDPRRSSWRRPGTSDMIRATRTLTEPPRIS